MQGSVSERKRMNSYSSREEPRRRRLTTLFFFFAAYLRSRRRLSLRPAPTGADAKCVLEQINKTLNGAAPVLPLASRLLYLEPENALRIDAPFQRRSDKHLLVITERR